VPTPSEIFADPQAFSRERARPLSPDERRAAIVDAIIPLLREQGRDISTRQIAEAAGVAEGTIFRAFGDKESIIEAAIARVIDPEPLRAKLRGIDPDEPTEDKVRQVMILLRERFTGFIGFMTSIGVQGPPPGTRPSDADWIATMQRIFRDDELGVPVETLAFYLRMIAFATSVPAFNAPREFDADELADLVVHGILGGTARTYFPPRSSTTTTATTTGKKD
jgi:AcrR family transcriptional regulator